MWIRALVIFALYALVAVFFVAMNVIRAALRQESLDWDAAVSFEILYWAAWAVITLFIAPLCSTLRLDRTSWRKVIAIHAAVGVVAAALQISLAYLLRWLLLDLSPAAGAMVASALLSYWKYWMVVGICYAFDYYRLYRDQTLATTQLEARLARAELDALRMQLQPHFLFNTLNAIAMLMGEDLAKANRMLLRLSDFLRLTLESSGKHEVSLRHELALLERYLEILQIRFEDRLQVGMTIDPATLEASVPNLILQPLVENAVRHGIAQRAEAGRIEIRTSRWEDRLFLIVHDDGCGLPGAGTRDGVGLSNTRARLTQLYGEGQSLQLRNAEVSGTEVQIMIPFRLHQP